MSYFARFGPRAAIWAILFVVAVVVGCGRAGPGRLPVCGTVTPASGEKFSGSISFLPAEGRPGPAATTSLTDGEYRFDRQDGPTAGPHRVVVNMVIPKGAALEARNKKAPAAGGKTSWTLSAEVPANGPYQCDFKLDK